MGTHRVEPSAGKTIALTYNCQEGDVIGVMERPLGESEEVHAEQDKWFVDLA